MNPLFAFGPVVPKRTVEQDGQGRPLALASRRGTYLEQVKAQESVRPRVKPVSGQTTPGADFECEAHGFAPGPRLRAGADVVEMPGGYECVESSGEHQCTDAPNESRAPGRFKYSARPSHSPGARMGAGVYTKACGGKEHGRRQAGPPAQDQAVRAQVRDEHADDGPVHAVPRAHDQGRVYAGQFYAD